MVLPAMASTTTRTIPHACSAVLAVLVVALWEPSAALSFTALQTPRHLNSIGSGKQILRNSANQTLLKEGTEKKGLPLFVDVSKHAFPHEWYSWDHVGFPRRYAGTPVIQDLNGDGVPDFFYHNHYEMNPSTDWDMGISGGSNDVTRGKPFWMNVGRKLLQCTDPPGSEWTKIASDTHGTAILDIDRDGLLDMYIATGGGMGKASGPQKNAMVMWGERSASSVAGMNQIFKGGRALAEQQNLHNPDSRGRFTYFADFNNDGLLDLVFANEVRVDDENSFGYAMINQGQRKFAEHKELSEYANTMILTDADGDGHAAEFVVQRSACLPMDGPDGTEAAQASFERKKFCESRPMGSTAIYRFNPGLGKLVQIAPQSGQPGRGPYYAWSMQTGDFDGDEKADLLVLYENAIEIYLSGSRKRGVLPVGQPTTKIRFNNGCNARALRVADLNLDGQEELVVMCRQPAKHMVYERSGSRWIWKNHYNLGDLSSRVLPLVDDKKLRRACGPRQPSYLSKHCTSLQAHRALPQVKPYGMSVVDFDNDGFKDVVLTHDVGTLMLLRNTWASAGEVDGDTVGNKFLAVKLRGNQSNVYGVGATVLLRAHNMGSGQDETLVQLREVYSASHDADWWGGRDDRIIFGLGQSGVPEVLTIRWPGRSRKIQIIANKPMLLNHMNDMKNPLVVHEPV